MYVGIISMYGVFIYVRIMYVSCTLMYAHLSDLKERYPSDAECRQVRTGISTVDRLQLPNLTHMNFLNDHLSTKERKKCTSIE